MAAYKRQEWNDLLGEVNEILQNPEGDCDPIDTIPLVQPSHRWAKSDIREVQDKLSQTCPDIAFGDMPELWKQDTIDEIREAMEQAWCDCDECECVFQTCEFGVNATNNAFKEVFLMDAVCDFNCLPLGEGGNTASSKMDWAPRINGMQVALKGFVGRRWRVFRYNPNSGEKAFVTPFGSGTSGTIDCEGKIVCTSDTTGGKGMTVFKTVALPHQLWVRLSCGPVSGVPQQCRDCEFDPVKCHPPGWPADFLPGSTAIMVGCCP